MQVFFLHFLTHIMGHAVLLACAQGPQQEFMATLRL